MTKAIFFTKNQFIIITVFSLVAIIGIPIGVSIWGNDFAKHNYGTIVIHNDSDFSLRYNFPGNGTKTNPYLIENLVIDNTKEYGIYIDYTTKHFLIRNCSINGVSNGIYIKNVGVGNVWIENNSINIIGQEDSFGISISNSPQSIIKNNYIECKNRDQSDLTFGLYLYICSDSEISFNNISTCTRAINIYHSDSLIITHNTVYTNFIGMYIDNVDNCNITYNTIMFNQNYGLYLRGYMNTIILNNFFTNQMQPESIYDKQAMDHYSNNFWSDIGNRKGNYWSDLSWTETAVYIVDHGGYSDDFSYDYYPLKYPI